MTHSLHGERQRILFADRVPDLGGAQYMHIQRRKIKLFNQSPQHQRCRLESKANLRPLCLAQMQKERRQWKSKV